MPKKLHISDSTLESLYPITKKRTPYLLLGDGRLRDCTVVIRVSKLHVHFHHGISYARDRTHVIEDFVMWETSLCNITS